MILDISISRPLENPVLIFTLVIIIILIAPVFFRKIKIPEVVGLLFCGALIGPNGFNLISPELEFSILGTTGMLYLMFLAGFEINLKDFFSNKLNSIVFGVLSFLLPFAIGYTGCYYILRITIPGSLIIASMLASHTLITYPIISRLGIANKPIFSIIIGATIIADILALLALEIVTDYYSADLNNSFYISLLVKFLLLFILIFWIIPKLARWFLNNYTGDISVQFVFVISVVFICSASAYLLGIEPIIGAFLSGLILNRFIISTTPLHKRVVFVGNTLFIPIFIISVGVLANFQVIFQDISTIYQFIFFILAATVGKYLAGRISLFMLKLSKRNNMLFFGMTYSKAASAIAIMLIGYNNKFIDESMINNTILLILVTCTISSFITEKKAKEIIKDDSTEYKSLRIREKILIPIANPSSIEHLINFALLIKDTRATEPIYPLSIVPDNETFEENIGNSHGVIEKIIYSAANEYKVEIVTRIDLNVSNGISRAVKELMISFLVIGWHKKSRADIIFNPLLKNLLRKTNKMIFVVKTPLNIEKLDKIDVIVTPNAELEIGFNDWIDKVALLAEQLKRKARFYLESSTISYIEDKAKLKKKLKNVKLNKVDINTFNIIQLWDNMTYNGLLLFIHARNQTVSYNPYIKQLIKAGFKKKITKNMIVIYPEQKYSESED